MPLLSSLLLPLFSYLCSKENKKGCLTMTICGQVQLLKTAVGPYKPQTTHVRQKKRHRPYFVCGQV